MTSLAFKTAPQVDGVMTSHPDGLYLYEVGDDLKQVIMVGDNLPSPQTVADAFGPDFVFDGAFMLRGSDESTERICRARGFISVLIRKRGSTRQFSSGIQEHSFEPIKKRDSAYESWDGWQ